MKEEWRPVKGHDGYEVSSLGRVRSLDRYIESAPGSRAGAYRRFLKGRDIKPFMAKTTGYHQVKIGKNGKKSLHKIVAEAFCEGYSDGMWVNHKNGIRTDNRAANLEWVTPSQNVRHGFSDLGRVPPCRGKFGKDHHVSKAVIATCQRTGEQKRYESGMDAVRDGYESSAISRCCNGKSKTHQGMSWRFAS